jgi:exopolyphosphatase/guanosine-5'-triphosphate,3'-diphosphate pyrophosphatase
MILTNRYFVSDPPGAAEVEELSRHVDQCLLDAHLNVPGARDLSLLVGTGGTVATLAVMLHGIPLGDITADRINGLLLRRRNIEVLFSEIRNLSLSERLKLPGLDKGRADVILAGCLTVIRILYFFKSLQLKVSLSDLLEGILIESSEGEGND